MEFHVAECGPVLEEARHYGVYIREADLARIRLALDRYWPIKGELPCGQSFEFKEEPDFPTEDMPCPCGDPTHFIVKYE